MYTLYLLSDYFNQNQILAQVYWNLKEGLGNFFWRPFCFFPHGNFFTFEWLNQSKPNFNTYILKGQGRLWPKMVILGLMVWRPSCFFDIFPLSSESLTPSKPNFYTYTLMYEEKSWKSFGWPSCFGFQYNFFNFSQAQPIESKFIHKQTGMLWKFKWKNGLRRSHGLAAILFFRST